MQVAPLERSVQADTQSSSLAMLVLVALIITGGIVSIYIGERTGIVLAGVLLVSILGIRVLFSAKPKYEFQPGDFEPHQEFSGSLPSDSSQHAIGPLQYETPYRVRQQAKTPAAVQGLAGFGAWILGLILIIWAANDTGVRDLMRSLGFINDGWILLPAALALFALICGAVFLHIKYQWRAFLPGLVLGIVLTCLVPIGIVFVVCGGMKF